MRVEAAGSRLLASHLPVGDRCTLARMGPPRRSPGLCVVMAGFGRARRIRGLRAMG